MNILSTLIITHQLPFKLLCEVCSVIMDTGYIGSVESYIKQYYGKEFSQLTVIEAELIIKSLGDKKGCLYEGDPKDLEITPIPNPLNRVRGLKRLVGLKVDND